MAESETRICNQALARAGSTRINDLEKDGSVPAIHCRTHYEPTRDSLLRLHWWRFARARAELSQDTVDPDFEWDNQFILPTDFMRFRSIFEETNSTSKSRRHSIEGDRLLTNLDEVSLRYIKKVTDASKFDPLFVEVLVLLLAKKLIPILAGTEAARLMKDVKDDLKALMPKVLAVDEDETDVGGRSDWNLARHGGLGIAGQEERLW